MAERTPSSEQRDPLAGDWSDGLPGPSRPHGIPAPQPLFFETAQAARSLEELSAQPPAEVVDTPDAWGAAAEDPLQSAPPDPLQSAPADPLHSRPPPAAEGFAVDPFAAFAPPAPFAPGTPLAPAEAFVPAEAAAVEEDEIVELGADDEAEPQPHEAALLSEIETAEPIVEEPVVELKPQDEAPPAESPAADWSTFSKGPDWSAPAPAEAAPETPAWDAPAEPAQTWSTESAWTAPAQPAPAAAAEPEWSAPPPAPPEPAGWTSANTTLLQMEGEPEPVVPEPGAAQELFGSVPVGGTLAGDDDENELPAAEEVEDPDLPVPVEEDADLPVAVEPAAADDADLPVAVDALAADDAFAAFASEPDPASQANDSAFADELREAPPGLRVPGEHRVAVHTRGGSTKRGVVRDVDLSQRAFALEPAAGGDGEDVQHDDVKAIFFMLPPGESARPGGHGRVKVTFADGRSIEGERDGAEDKNGFFLVPQDAARTNTWRIYVARDATTEIRDL